MQLGLKQILPKVYAEAVEEIESQSFSPAPLANSVVTSDNGRVLAYKFYGSGVWEKQSNNSFIIMYLWNGGCGGGSGSYGVPGGGVGPGLAGGGGAGGNSLVLMLPGSYFTTSTNITVGAGGNGGASTTGINTTGNPGLVGGQSFVGNLTVPLKPAGVGGGGRAAGGTSAGGTAGSSSYVLSGGYSIADGTMIGCNANPGAEVNFAYNPALAVIGTGPIQIPCLPYAVATGGGSGGDTVSTAGRSGGTPGGSIILFGNINTMGGYGAQIGNQVGIGQPMCGPGTYFSWPYGGIFQNWYGQMFVTGGTGGGGPGQGATQNVNAQQVGGPGGIGAGGGGGAGRSAGGAPPPAGSGVGGRGGQGYVAIYEFI